jgi:hypothetical protein
VGGGGSVTGISITVPEYYPVGSTPANPVTLLGAAGSKTLAVNFAYTTATTLALQPSGGPTTVGGTLKTTGGVSAFGATPPASKPAITGSRGSATATVLASLLTALAAAGFITDSTTA